MHEIRIQTTAILTALFALGWVACGSGDLDAADDAALDNNAADTPSNNNAAETPSNNNAVETPSNNNAADAGGDSGFATGARGLFIGQSFFVPVAQAFDVSVGRGDFPKHSIDTVFAGGASGSPQALWENESRRTEIDQKLATGEFELFGMTIGPLYEDNPAEFYGRWIELALSYNPDTQIFIGFPYLQGGPTADTAAYELEITDGGDNFFTLVQGLRSIFPDTKIVFFNYGKALSQMKAEFEDGQLEDIDALVAPRGSSSPDERRRYLFAEGGVGHAGPMAEHVCALVWARLLYGAEIAPLVDPSYNRDDVERIANDVIVFNQRYR